MLLKKIVSLFILSLLAVSCARYANLGGGLEDKSAPVNEVCVPENYSTQMNTGKIVITFDEYVVLKNFNQEFIASPVFNEKPQKIVRGKSIILKFNKDSLKPNTTYTLNFGNSIVDYRAGNILENYQYIFSTGAHIDSLSISGHLYMAKDLSPQKQVYILLYKDAEKLPLKNRKPDFIGKTNESGFFSINHIPAGRYTICALNDVNSNYQFDLPNEQIAFLDSSFVLKTVSVQDTLQDSTNVQAYKTLPNNIDLFLFEEYYQNVYISDYKRINNHLLQLYYSETLDSNIQIKFKEFDKGFIVEPNLARDTFNIWITDTNLCKKDTFEMYLSHYKTDSLGNLSKLTDSLTFKEKVQDAKKDTMLNLKTNLSKSAFDFYKQIQLKTDFPVQNIDTSRIQLYEKDGEDKKEVLFDFQQDTINIRKFNLLCTLKEKTDYQLKIVPKAFVDYRGLINDTLKMDFTTTDNTLYGDIILNIKGLSGVQKIIQLLDNGDKVLQTKFVNQQKQIHFEHLKVSKYRIKLIEDRNANKKWDSGNYEEQRQAEKVKFFPNTIETKQNWTLELDWELEP